MCWMVWMETALQRGPRSWKRHLGQMLKGRAIGRRRVFGDEQRMESRYGVILADHTGGPYLMKM